MADKKPTENFYDNLGGINLKASEYAVGRAQFLDIRNLDFDVPNALTKRPGSTQAVSSGTSGPVNSLFEFIKLTGESYVIAGSDTAMFYLSANQFTLLDTGWTNGQPTDMLTFVNRLWMANGQNYKWWDGATLAAAGLPVPPTVLGLNDGPGSGATWWLVGGATYFSSFSGAAPFTVRCLFVAYSYVRFDGYQGPCNFLASARNIVGDVGAGNRLATSGSEFFNFYTLLSGFTAVAAGITAINIWVGADTITDASPTEYIDGGLKRVGNLGYISKVAQAARVLKPTADLSRFNLYTTIATTDLFPKNISGDTLLCATFGILSFSAFATVASGAGGFSGMNGSFFSSYTPKYIETNQNYVFMSGFSSAPSVAWISNLGEPEFVEPENFFEVRTNDGDRIYASKAYNNYILYMKETSFHKVIGNSPDNFELVQLSDQYGCISNKTVIEYKEKLVWLDRKGILQFDGAGWAIISNSVEDIFRRMNITAAKENACAVNWEDRNQVWFGIPIDGSTQNNITIVWDYLIDAWTFFDGFNVASFASIKAQNSRAASWRGDYSGLVHYHSDQFYGDSGRGITCIARPHWDKWQGENSTNIWRRLFLDVNVATGGTGIITGKVFSNYDNATVRATFSMYQSQFQSRAEMGVQGKAVSVEFAHISASLPLQINGFAWAKRNLRNV